MVHYTIGRQSNEPNFSRGNLIRSEGENGILVEKCKIQFNKLTPQISDESCNTSYVWLGGEGGIKKAEEGNNNVITIK